jgi:ribonuclease P protein component
VGRNTLKRSEKLKSSRIIGELFSSGDTITVLPVKLFWKLDHISNHRIQARMAITVPYKNFKRSVDRNLVKRRIREAYRLNKHNLYNLLFEKKFSLIFVFLYLPKNIHSYQEIEEGVIRVLTILSDQLKSVPVQESI